MTLETRALTSPIEVRAGDAGRTAVGYAAMFNSETVIGGQFREVIAPGAFAQSLRSGDVVALFGHDQNRVLGRMSAGTLRLSEDETGLRAEIDLPDTADGRDLAVLLQRGDIQGMSFGFRVAKGGDTWDDSGDIPLRTIRAAQLGEVSAVAFPAYPDTSLGLRSLEAARKQTNFSAAARRLRLKATLDLKVRK